MIQFKGGGGGGGGRLITLKKGFRAKSWTRRPGNVPTFDGGFGSIRAIMSM